MSPSKGGELIPAPHYDPGADIVGGPRSQVRRYIRAIRARAEWLQSLIEKLFTSTRDRTATEKLFLLSGLHHNRMFIDILSAIQEPRKEIRDALKLVEDIARELQRLLKMVRGPWRMNIRMVPKLTYYELAIRITIERVEMMREERPSKERIGNFLSSSHRGSSICLT